MIEHWDYFAGTVGACLALIAFTLVRIESRLSEIASHLANRPDAKGVT